MMMSKLTAILCMTMASCLSIITPAFSETIDTAIEEASFEDNSTYHLYDDVDLISTIKFEYGRPKIIIKLIYPQLASDTEQDAITQFNDLALQIVRNEINMFRNQVKAHAVNQKHLTSSQITNNFYMDFSSSFLKSKYDYMLSIRFSAQEVITGIKRAHQRYLALNYNLSKNQIMALSDLFSSGSNYLEILSQYAQSILSRRFPHSVLIIGGTAPNPENFKTWNIKANGLLLTFDSGTVAPYAYGSQTVLVPYSALAHIILPDSPIAACVANPATCVNKHFLTGGFIDEASNTRHRRFNPRLSQA
jgi:hypothetical protein